MASSQTLLDHLTPLLTKHPAFSHASFQQALIRNHLVSVISHRPEVFPLHPSQRRDLLRLHVSAEELAALVTAMLQDADSCVRFLNTLSPKSRDLLKFIAWDGPHDPADIRTKQGVTVYSPRDFSHLPNNDQAVALMFLNVDIAGENNFPPAMVRMDPRVAAAFRKASKPAGGRLLMPMPEEPDAVIFECEDPAGFVPAAFLKAREPELRIRRFESLADRTALFHKDLKVKEFYPGDPYLGHLRAGLLLLFMSNVPGLGSENDPQSYAAWIDRFWMHPNYPYHLHLDHLYLKGSNLQGATGYPAIVKRALLMCPTDTLVDADDLFKALYRKEIPLAILKGAGQLMVRKGDRELPVSTMPEEFLYRPGLYLALFQMASLGLLDLTYVRPQDCGNPAYRIFEQGFLTPYDGLRQVRLTELGAYIIGRSDAYRGAWQSTQKAALDFHDQDLIISMTRRDHVTEQFLKQFARPIGTRRFLVDHASFLNGIQTGFDLKRRIDMLTQKMEDPPANWRAFFESVQSRIEPFEKERSYTVLKLGPDPELAALIVRDEELRQIVVKAENRMILVHDLNYYAFKKRLADLGYLL